AFGITLIRGIKVICAGLKNKVTVVVFIIDDALCKADFAINIKVIRQAKSRLLTGVIKQYIIKIRRHIALKHLKLITFKACDSTILHKIDYARIFIVSF